MKLIRVSVGIGAFVLTAAVAGLFAQAPAQGGAAQAGAGGRGGQPPAAPTNLQVLPKDISREELIATMRGYTAGLGVQCNYCHVQEGRGGRLIPVGFRATVYARTILTVGFISPEDRCPVSTTSATIRS